VGSSGDDQPLPPVDPAIALRPGRTDAIVLLSLWAARRAFLPLLLLGLISGWLTGLLNNESDVAEAFDTIGELLGALLTPLAGIALAIVIRVVVGWLALVSAWPLASWRRTGPRTLGQRYRDAVDRWRLAQAYRSLRWTWGVRARAIEQAGAVGRKLGLAVPVSIGASIVLVIVFSGLLAVS
jgi:hypothetical protein